MKEPSINDLLTPELDGFEIKEPIFSVQSHCLVAFFGGPIAILCFSMWGMRNVGLIKKFVVHYVVLSLLAFAAVCVLFYLKNTDWPSWLMLGSNPTVSMRRLVQILAILIFGVLYLFQKQYFAVANMRGVDAPSPWVAAILCIILAHVISMLAAFIVGEVL